MKKPQLHVDRIQYSDIYDVFYVKKVVITVGDIITHFKNFFFLYAAASFRKLYKFKNLLW